MEHPLVNHADGALGAHLVRHRVLGEHRKAKGVNQLGDGVVDLGVVVIGAPCQHDAVGVVLLHPGQGLVAGAVHGVLEVDVGLPGNVHGLVDLCAGDVLPVEASLALGGVLLALDRNDLVQAALELALVVIRNEGRKVLHAGVRELVHVEPQRLRVAHHDGAVVVVGGGVVLLALPADAGHPDKVRVLGKEIHDVAVAQLCRIARGLGGHGLDAGVVGLRGRLVRDHHREAQLGEERVPEGVVLVHVERARDAHRATRRGLCIQAGTVEQQLVLELEEVGGVVFGLARTARALLAAVTRDEAVAAAKVVDREQAVVCAAPAVDVGVLDLEVVDVLAREDRRGTRGARAVTGEKRRAVGAHAAGDIGADDLAASEQLEGAQGGVAHEGAALDHAVLANLVKVAQLDDLEEGVLDHGVREARGHVANGRTLLLRLLDAGVHEDGAAATQVNGGLCGHGDLRKVLDAHVHGLGKALDKRAAARGAGLVEHDVLDDATAHLEALHVLAANVENELDAWDEGLRAAQVGDGLDLARVRAQGLDEDALAVARGGHVANGATLGHGVVDAVHDVARSAQDVAVVVAVPGVEKLAVLAHHGALHGGGASVDANEDATAVAGQVTLGHDLLVVALLELLVVLLGGKERVQTLDLGALDVLQLLERADDLGKGHALVGLARQRGAGRHEEVRVGGNHAVLLVEVKRDVEAAAQLGEVLQGTAEKRHVALDGVTAGQARDGLRDHGLEDGGGHVLGAGALVEQRLDVGLGKDAAAAGDGVDLRGALGQLVQAHGVGLEESCHLVDEGARAAGAGAVHALLDAVVKVDNLGVLAAQLDGDVGLRDEGLHGALGRDDLLDKLEVEPLGKQHAAGAGNRDAHGDVAHHALGAREELLGRGADVGVVALVVGVDQVPRGVNHGELDRGRANVDAQAQVGAGEVLRRCGIELRAVLGELERLCSCVVLGHQLLSSSSGSMTASAKLGRSSSMGLSYRSPGRTNMRAVMMRAMVRTLSRMPPSSQRRSTPTSADIAKVR